MSNEANKAWWFPELCDKSYFDRLREDYEEASGKGDEQLLDEYNDGRKYSVTWDHIGDAYAQYEPMADCFLQMHAALEKMTARFTIVSDDDYAIRSEAVAALAKARGES